MGNKEIVTKTEAAERQLETAIRLFLQEGDRVSIHTLTAAAHGILHDLGPEFEPAKGFYLMQAAPFIKPERLKEWVQALRRPQNFFKHADKDPDATVELGEFHTEHLLLEACMMYFLLTKQLPWAIKTYYAWYTVSYPKYLLDDNPWTDFALQVRDRAEKMGLPPNEKATFLGVWELGEVLGL